MRRKMLEMTLYYDKNSSDLTRDALNHYYGTVYRKEAFGYMAGVKPSQRRDERTKSAEDTEDTIEKIRAMDDEALTTFLIEIGFSEPNEDVDGMGKSERRWIVRTDSTDGVRKYYETHYNLLSNKESYARHVYTIDELINVLKREKKI